MFVWVGNLGVLIAGPGLSTALVVLNPLPSSLTPLPDGDFDSLDVFCGFLQLTMALELQQEALLAEITA